MTSTNEDASKTVTADKELDDLLDSALADLTNQSDGKTDVVPTAPPADGASGDDKLELGDDWSDEYVREASLRFEQNMADFFAQMGGDGQGVDFAASLQKMTEVAAQMSSQLTDLPVGGDDAAAVPGASGGVAAALAETLKNLSEGAANAQNAFSEENITNMLMNMGLDDQNENGMYNSMLKIMETLLSKDVIYPTIKETTMNYPTWLEANKDKISPEDYERYQKQNKLMVLVCEEFEKETESESDSVKSERCTRVIELMQQLQDSGDLPKELVGDANPDMDLTTLRNSMPQLFTGDANQQCSIM